MRLSDSLTIIGTFIFLALALSFFLALPVMLLWNYCLVPAVNGVNEVTWLQSWGIMVLFSFLFKNSTTVKSASK
jgi:hypothetical protein